MAEKTKQLPGKSKEPDTEWWTARHASKILGIPYEIVRKAYRSNEITEHYFGSSRAYAKASDVRHWADRSPTKLVGQWL